GAVIQERHAVQRRDLSDKWSNATIVTQRDADMRAKSVSPCAESRPMLDSSATRKRANCTPTRIPSDLTVPN
ncbi:MAG: hypothetical protein ACTSX8_09930, partial [Alphaproteobacteria bacterium]